MDVRVAEKHNLRILRLKTVSLYVHNNLSIGHNRLLKKEMYKAM